MSALKVGSFNAVVLNVPERKVSQFIRDMARAGLKKYVMKRNSKEASFVIDSDQKNAMDFYHSQRVNLKANG